MPREGDGWPRPDDGAIAVHQRSAADSRALAVAERLGGFLGLVLGTAADAVLTGDALQQARIGILAGLERRTAAILRDRGRAVADTAPVSPSIAIPLLKAARDESRPALQELWARLLANAMDGTRGEIRQSFIETVLRLEPIDTAVLQIVFEHGGFDRHAGNAIAGILHARFDEIDVSLRHLHAIGCIAIHDSAAINLTSLGRELMRACRD